jgi:hypothetical protein
MLLLLSEWDPVKGNLIDDIEELHRLMGQKQKYDRMVLHAQRNSADLVPQIAEFEERVQILQQHHVANESVKSHLDQELSFKTTAMYQIKDDIARDEQRLTALKPSPASVPRPFNGARDSKPSSTATTRVANWAQDSKQECAKNFLSLLKSKSNKVPDSFTINRLNTKTLMYITTNEILDEAWDLIKDFALNPACPSELKDKKIHHPPRLIEVFSLRKRGKSLKFAQAFDIPVHPLHAVHVDW